VSLRLRERARQTSREIDEITRRCLEHVELAGTEKKMPSELSGGMRKRVAIARALAIDPELILYDEPTADLDPILTEGIGRLIRRIRETRGATQIIVTHNLPLARSIADRIAVLDAGGSGVRHTGGAREEQTPAHPRVHARRDARRARRALMLTREQKIGLFFIVGIVLFLVAIELTLGLGLLRSRYPLYATFPDVQGLDAGADVRLAGLKAGRVDSLSIEERHVRVKMLIDRGLEVKKDSIARLDFRALSGERLSRSRSAPRPRRPRSPAPRSRARRRRASRTPSISSRPSRRTSELTQSLKTNSERLLANLADVVEQNRDALGDTAQHLASITGKLDRGTGTLGLLLNDPALYERATSALGDVQQSVKDLGTVARDLSAGKGTLGKLVTADDGLYEQVRQTVDDLSATAQNAQEITDRLRQGEGTLGLALTDPSLYNEAQDTLRTVNRATQSLEDQSAISLLGTIVTSLF
jgi:phospholipid/cholesterol/gamma-HCH transport system substrate-binding protein